MATPKTQRKPALTTTIRIPTKLRTRLGDAPADTIAELLSLQRAIGSVTLKQLAANPFLRVTLDATRKTQPFATSSIGDLRDWAGTERELLEQATRVSGLRPEALARTGLLRQAALEIQNDYRRTHTPADGPKRGVTGNRDGELRDAVNGHFKALGRVSASSLRTKTGVPFRACLRFLQRQAATLGLYLEDGSTTNYTWKPPIVDAPAARSAEPLAATEAIATPTVGSGARPTAAAAPNTKRQAATNTRSPARRKAPRLRNKG